MLCADNQHEETEKTFAVKDKHSYQLQFAMMIMSTFHFGNHASSVDYVVAHLRRGKEIYPRTCYKEVILGGKDLLL